MPGTRLRADVDANRWALTKQRVCYEGSTPSNDHGHAAVLT